MKTLVNKCGKCGEIGLALFDKKNFVNSTVYYTLICNVQLILPVHRCAGVKLTRLKNMIAINGFRKLSRNKEYK